MADFVLDVGSTIICPHPNGTSTLSTTNTKVFVNGKAVVLQSDIFSIAGCLFAPGGNSSPCLTLEWTKGASKVLVNGTSILHKTSTGICKNVGGFHKDRLK